MYNLVLTEGHTVQVQTTLACTLGHSFKGPVIEHPFYGTNKVIEAFQTLPGWQKGQVALDPRMIQRHTPT